VRRLSVGIREAKMNLSRLLKDVREGAEIILTERGQPVARLVPLAPETLSVEARVRRLEQNGWISPAARDGRPLPPPLPVPDDLAQRYLEKRKPSSPVSGADVSWRMSSSTPTTRT